MTSQLGILSGRLVIAGRERSWMRVSVCAQKSDQEEDLKNELFKYHSLEDELVITTNSKFIQAHQMHIQDVLTQKMQT